MGKRKEKKTVETNTPRKPVTYDYCSRYETIC